MSKYRYFLIQQGKLVEIRKSFYTIGLQASNAVLLKVRADSIFFQKEAEEKTYYIVVTKTYISIFECGNDSFGP